MNHSIIATDDMGSVRLFEYPIIASDSDKEKQDVALDFAVVENEGGLILC
jgi:hypothetical protein